MRGKRSGYAAAKGFREIFALNERECNRTRGAVGTSENGCRLRIEEIDQYRGLIESSNFLSSVFFDIMRKVKYV